MLIRVVAGGAMWDVGCVLVDFWRKGFGILGICALCKTAHPVEWSVWCGLKNLLNIFRIYVRQKKI